LTEQRRRQSSKTDIPNIPFMGGPDQEIGRAFMFAVYEVAKSNCDCASCQFVRLLIEQMKGGRR